MPDPASTDNNNLPHVQSKPDRELSWIWIIPVIAVLIGIALVWQSYAERGPLIEINVVEGGGVKAGDTEVKYKDVTVGVVEEVVLSKNLESVIIKARMDKAVSDYLGETTTFSIISAQIQGTNFTGLSTLLSGPYIEMDWSEKAKQKQREFKGLNTPPLTPPGEKGTRLTLFANSAGSIGVGSPVLYRNMPVGKIESRKVSEDLNSVEYSAFVKTPYDTLIRSNSKFWDASGVKMKVGASGFQLDIASVNTLLSGGVSFGNIGSSPSGSPLEKDSKFRIYADETSAFDSDYDEIQGSGYLFMSYFNSVVGLEQDSAVYWEGIRIGTVRDVVADVSQATKERGLYVVYEIQPRRIGMNNIDQERVRIGLNNWVKGGIRAQLGSTNILSSKKVINMIKTEDNDGLDINMDSTPYPEIPSIPENMAALSQNIDELLSNLADLPLDQLIEAAVRVLNHTDSLVSDPNMKSLPANISNTLTSFQGMANNIELATRNLPVLIENINTMADTGEMALAGLSPNSDLYIDLSGAVRDLRETSRSLSALARRLELNPNSIITGR